MHDARLGGGVMEGRRAVIDEGLEKEQGRGVASNAIAAIGGGRGDNDAGGVDGSGVKGDGPGEEDGGDEDDDDDDDDGDGDGDDDDDDDDDDDGGDDDGDDGDDDNDDDGGDDEDDDDDAEEDEEDEDDGEDDTTGEGGGNRMEVQPTLELMELVECMAADRRIGADQTLRLHQLIRSLDPRVMSAHQDYVVSQDVNPLVETLVGIVANEEGSATATADDVEGDVSRSGGAGAGGEGCTSEEAVDARLSGGGAGDASAKIRGRASLKHGKIVTLMQETKVLEPRDASRIQMLLRQEDPKTLAAFDVFQSSKDVADLVETLKIVLKTSPLVGGETSGGVPQGSEATLSGSVERGRRSSAGAGAGPDARGTVPGGSGGEADERMAHIIIGVLDSIGLDEREAASLRLAIACGDANIRGALEVFRLDNDVEELKDTLRRVARHVLESETTQPESEKDKMDDSVEVPLGEDYDPRDPKSEASDPKHGDMETAEGLDLTEEGGEVLFQELLRQLVSVGMINEGQARVVLSRYREGDAVVLAALDVYKHENEMSELVDTLKRVT